MAAPAAAVLTPYGWTVICEAARASLHGARRWRNPPTQSPAGHCDAGIASPGEAKSRFSIPRLYKSKPDADGIRPAIAVRNVLEQENPSISIHAIAA
jgi:hypothetical protein